MDNPDRPHPSIPKPGSAGDCGCQPLFLPLGPAVVGLPHPDSTFPRGWWSLVVEAPCPSTSDPAPGGWGWMDKGGGVQKGGGGGYSCRCHTRRQSKRQTFIRMYGCSIHWTPKGSLSTAKIASPSGQKACLHRAISKDPVGIRKKIETFKGKKHTLRLPCVQKFCCKMLLWNVKVEIIPHPLQQPVTHPQSPRMPCIGQAATNLSFWRGRPTGCTTGTEALGVLLLAVRGSRLVPWRGNHDSQCTP